MGERDALQRELEELKRKAEGTRSRNKVLSSEVKTLRSQMGTLVEKGRHDDELIDALVVRKAPPQAWPPLPTHVTQQVRVSSHLPRDTTCVTQKPTAPKGSQPHTPSWGGSNSEATQACAEGGGCDVAQLYASH